MSPLFKNPPPVSAQSNFFNALQQFPNVLSIECSSNGAVIVEVRCYHGVDLRHDISPFAIDHMGGNAAAIQAMDWCADACKTLHSTVPVPAKYSALPIPAKWNSGTTNPWSDFAGPWTALAAQQKALDAMFAKWWVTQPADQYQSGLIGTKVTDALGDLVPASKTEMVDCPQGGCPARQTILALVPHINDGHKWSREHIADWLDSLPIDLTIRPKEHNGSANAGPKEVARKRRHGKSGSSCKWGDVKLG